MGVKSLHLEPDPAGSLVILGGDNGAGKSSTINAIWWALGGKPSVIKPIRAGQTKAEITLDLGDLIVVRRFWYPNDDETQPYKSDLKVTSAKDTIGAVAYQRPQQVLDALISKFAFDPFEFTRMGGKLQVDKVKTALGIDFTDVDARHQIAYDERTNVNRELATMKARFAGQRKIEGVPDEEESLQDLTDELEQASEQNAQILEMRTKAESAVSTIERARSMITEQEERIARDQRAIDEHERRLRELNESLAIEADKLNAMKAKMPEFEQKAADAKKDLEGLEPVDTAPIRARISSVEQTNASIRANKALASAKAEWDEVEKRRVDLENTLDACKEERLALTQKAIAQAKLAVEGLTFDDDGLWVNGIPFAQCNTALQLQVSTALAVHENQRLRVFYIADGEKLTPNNMEALRQIAEDRQCQIWIEFACTKDDVQKGYREVSFLIEDGATVPFVVTGGQ